MKLKLLDNLRPQPINLVSQLTPKENKVLEVAKRCYFQGVMTAEEVDALQGVIFYNVQTRYLIEHNLFKVEKDKSE